MGIFLLAVFFILEGINLLASFMDNTIVGILMIVVGAVLLFEHRGEVSARVR